MPNLPDNVTVLGDPHLGRKFKTGVPLHRVGDRERDQWKEFQESLQTCKTKYHINMGDLFDKFVVPPEIVLRAAQIYKQAAYSNPNITYVVIEGNHDTSKDGSKASSFDLFANIVYYVDNIVIVSGEGVALDDDMVALPYHPFKTSEQVLDDIPGDYKVAFGHWDIVDFGGSNVIPTKKMAERGITLAVSGHDHLAREEKFHGVDVIVTGSMQPYTHAEDKSGEWYVTVTLEELAEMDVTDKNVRVLLREGEVLPTDLNCLSLTAKRVTDEDEKIEVDTSDFDTVDIKDLLARALEGLSCKETLLTQFEEGRDQ